MKQEVLRSVHNSLTNFGSFCQDVVVRVRKQDDSFGSEGLSVPDGAGGAVERAVGLDHHDGVGEVVVVESDHVVEVGKPAEVAVDQSALLDHVGTVDHLEKETILLTISFNH